MKTQEHPQAELLRAIADGKQMQETSQLEPYAYVNCSPERAIHLIGMHRADELRIKPATILVNGIEVPEPMRVAPERDTMVWIARVTAEDFIDRTEWSGSSYEYRMLERGLCHTTEAAAVAHAKAMLAPSMKGGGVMKRDDYLEAISDKIRHGEPVGLFEAIAAINYQEQLRQEKEANKPLARFRRWLNSMKQRVGKVAKGATP